MLFKLLLAFTLVPLIELYLLFQLAQATSFGTTLLIVLTTGVVGSILAKHEGLTTWRRLREVLSTGDGGPRFPSAEVRDGLMIAFAAALLLTPGILTDALGFTLLVPAGRILIAKHILPRLFRNLQFNVFAGQATPSEHWHSGASSRTSHSSNTIDAEAVRNRQ